MIIYREALSEKLRPISQFLTASEYQNLVNSMSREKELRVRIRELLRLDYILYFIVFPHSGVTVIELIP